MPRAAPLVISIAFTLVAAPRLARAHNLDHQRTPVVWTDAPCATVIDRARNGPIHVLDYGIPHEDTMLTADEPPDSRRHQFFAFCRDHHFEDRNPNWISMADLDIAVMLGLGGLDGIDPALDILDDATRWQDCFMRINADDDRRPITQAAAAAGVAWDTTELAAGTYVVEAYTWEPWFNLWTEHPGVFRIVDDPDPAANPPAAALTYAEQVVTVGDTAAISGCVAAMPGSTMSLAWVIGGSGVDPEWTSFVDDMPVAAESFELSLSGPESAIGHYLLVRLDVGDPQGRTWTAYGTQYIGVIGQPPASGDGDGDGDGDSGETGSGDSGADDAPLDDGTGGCSCRTSRLDRSPMRDLVWMIFLCGYIGRTRSRERAA